MSKSQRSILVLLALLATVSLFAQGLTTGTLIGTTTSEGNPLPGVSVTVSSRALQGTRTATTGDGGGFVFPALPPGDYTVAFELGGMQKIERHVTIAVAQTSRADADLKVAAVAEALTVTAAAPPAVESIEIAANFTRNEINQLPTGRTIDDVTRLAPGVNEAGPNNQIVISGANSYDNLFLVDGVIVNENLRGQPNPLYIEDAIQETTVLTGGISAEYGRFTGGVVNTITKSGGNDFSGSMRDSLTNPNWTEKSDFAGQVDPIDDINSSYEGTFGGRIIRDRLWFFTAGRYTKSDLSRQTTLTNIPYIFGTNDKRFEGKLTGQITQKHWLVGSYINSKDHRTNNVSGGRVVDLASLAPFNRPRSLFSLNYNGILTDKLLLEGQISRMNDKFTNGAETRDLINGTLLVDDDAGVRGWSPTFCGSPCPAKQRNNRGWLAKGSYFLSTKSAGNHAISSGIEEFRQLRNENNFQSGSDFRIHGIILCDKGGIAVACSSITSSQLSSTNIYFGTDTSAGEIEYDPVPALSKTSDFAVRSLFLNDKWDLTNRWSFNVGVRYDKASGSDQAGHKTVDDSAVSPRLAVNFDPKGNGRHRFSASYGRYVSKVDQGPADNTATAGRYASYYWDYKGPALNAAGTPVGQLLSTQQVIKQVFDWFNSAGGTKAGPPLLTDANIPGTTSRFDHSLQAPYMDEWTGGYALTFSGQGYLRADYIHRDWAAFYSIRRTIATGKSVDPNGNKFDQGVIENSDAGLSRKYNALQLQGNVRLMKALTLGGNYTYAKLRGNVEGESASGATGFTSFQSYPEYTNFTQFNPAGLLAADMRHRANIWLTYDLPSTPAGRFNVSLLQRYHSALSYSAVGTIDVRKGVSNGPANGVVNPGYETPPTNVSYYFSNRGAFKVDPISSTDLGLNWYLPSFRGLRPFIETDFLNVFSEQGVEDPDFIDRTVLTRRQSTCLQTGTTTRCLAFNPFTDTPQKGVNWQYGPSFGKPTSASAYQLPRTYRFSVGVKF